MGTNKKGWALWGWLGLIGVVLAFAGGCKKTSNAAVDHGAAPTLFSAKLTLSQVGQQTVVVSWDPAKDDSTASNNIQYQLFYNTQGILSTVAEVQQSAIALFQPKGAMTFFMAQGLASGQNHFFNLLAYDGGDQATLYNSASTITLPSPANLPPTAQGSLQFADSDADAGQLYGLITLRRASSEADLFGYNLYWGSSSTAKLSTTALTSLPKNGADQSYLLSTSTPSGATHLLWYAYNQFGEQASPASLAFTDWALTGGAQGLSLTDSDLDQNQLTGSLVIQKATDETNSVSYVLYWGSGVNAKLSGQTAIATYAKTGANLTHSFAANTAIPSGATHLLVYTTTASGEAASPAALPIVDLHLPLGAPTALRLYDIDPAKGSLAGTLTLTPATDETQVKDYALYWGSDTTTKLSSLPFAALPTEGKSLSLQLGSTLLPTGTTYLLAYSRGVSGEWTTPLAWALTDLDLETSLIVHLPLDSNGEGRGANLLSASLKGDPLPAAGRKGLPNGALYLLSEAGQYLDLGNSELFRPAQISFGGWFYKASWAQECDLSESLVSNFEGLGGYRLYCRQGRVYAEVRRYEKFANVSYARENLSGWAHLFVVYDGRLLKLYVNGGLVASDDALVTTPLQYQVANHLLVGAEAGTGATPTGGFFRGKLDELRFFSRALSATEVKAIFEGER